MRSPRPSLPILLAIAALVAVALARSDEIRARAESGLGRGMPTREAELARGFVLGEDESIDERTKEDFRRAGLSHLLAVSGQNVTLLALLAMPLMAALGIPLRERLVWVLGLIVVYVPLAGAGPSIQRAGVMGAAGRAGDPGGPARLTSVRAAAGARGHAGGRPWRRRRDRLAAQLRRGGRHLPTRWRRCARRSRLGLDQAAGGAPWPRVRP